MAHHLGTALFAKPRDLVWHPHMGGHAARTALGVFDVAVVPSTREDPHPLWRAALNGAPFPILAPTQEDARNLALLGCLAHGDVMPEGMGWEDGPDGPVAHGWGPDGTGGASPVAWTIHPSEGTAGWFAARNGQPAYAALADAEQAKAACAQYAAYVWLALGTIVGPGADLG